MKVLSESFLRLLMLPLLFALTPITVNASQTYYVSPTGNDAQPGTQTQPLRQIRKALMKVKASDLVLVADGSYLGFDVDSIIGSNTAPITIQAQGTNAVVLPTTDRSDNRDTIFIVDSSYMIIDGFRSFNANRAALRIEGGDHVTVRNCVFGNNATWGILTGHSPDLPIEKNVCYGSVTQHGIYVANSADRPVVRGNLFKNLHNPDSSAYPWNPSVLFWRHSAGTITEQNTFLNVDRAVAYGLDNTTPYFDHAGGVIRNNFVCLTPGLLSANRKASSDGALIAWNSPGTQIDHNTVLLNGNEYYAVECRFPTTTNCTARNNLTDAPIHLRDGATATLSSNLVTANAGMFINAAAGDLHLAASATNAIDKTPTLSTVTNDFDGELRPRGARSDIGADEFRTNAPPSNTSLRLRGADSIVSFQTFLGESYDVLRANDLAGSNWAFIASNISGSGDLFSIRDTNRAGQSRGFYRVRLSP